MRSVQVHRCRFVSALPSSIQCIALTSSNRQTLLAVCRENAQIECWEYSQHRLHFVKVHLTD
jgi:hypothetical protein